MKPSAVEPRQIRYSSSSFHAVLRPNLWPYRHSLKRLFKERLEIYRTMCIWVKLVQNWPTCCSCQQATRCYGGWNFLDKFACADRIGFTFSGERQGVLVDHRLIQLEKQVEAVDWRPQCSAEWTISADDTPQMAHHHSGPARLSACNIWTKNAK